MQALLPEFDARPFGFRIYLPLVLVLVLLVLQNLRLPGVAAMGLPAVFMLGSLAAAVCGRRFSYLKAGQEAVTEALPILSILAGVGMFIQVMTLVGARGAAVLAFLSLPPALLYAGIAVGMPLFGGVSAFGSASVLGVPFLLALSGSNALLVAAALSAIVGIGDFIPPAAMAARFSAQVAGERNLGRVLRACTRTRPAHPGRGPGRVGLCPGPGQGVLMRFVYLAIVLYLAGHLLWAMVRERNVWEAGRGGHRPAPLHPETPPYSIARP